MWLPFRPTEASDRRCGRPARHRCCSCCRRCHPLATAARGRDGGAGRGIDAGWRHGADMRRGGARPRLAAEKKSNTPNLYGRVAHRQQWGDGSTDRPPTPIITADTAAPSTRSPPKRAYGVATPTVPSSVPLRLARTKLVGVSSNVPRPAVHGAQRVQVRHALGVFARDQQATAAGAVGTPRGCGAAAGGGRRIGCLPPLSSPPLPSLPLPPPPELPPLNVPSPLRTAATAGRPSRLGAGCGRSNYTRLVARWCVGWNFLRLLDEIQVQTSAKHTITP